MKWTFHPKNEKLTTSLPMSIEVSEIKGRARISVSEIGELELKEFKPGIMKTDFYVSLPGKYIIELRDQETHFLHEIEVDQHTYLNFTKEFGFFLVLFIIVMGGIIIWTSKIMKSRTT